MTARIIEESTVHPGRFGEHHSPDAPMIHDLENAGDTEIGFVPVELRD